MEDKVALNDFDTVSYPEHKHPHGPSDVKADTGRVWVCTECSHIFTDSAVRVHDTEDSWGHPCQMHPQRKGQRCESHLEPFMPEVK